jgi:transposase
MYKPGQNTELRAREIAWEIEKDIMTLSDVLVPTRYDIIQWHILDILKHPECPQCGSKRLTGECGHVWRVR